MFVDATTYALLGVSGYLVGSVPIAYLLVRRRKGLDLTQVGSGNVGVINAFVYGGAAIVALTVSGEIVKAAAAVGLASWIGDGTLHHKIWALYAAFLGTNFSIFLKGKGGKGSTLFIWGQAFIALWIPIALGLVALACFLGTRWWIHAKRLWLVFIPPLFYLGTQDWIYAAYGTITVIILAIRTTEENDDFRVHGFVNNDGRDPLVIDLENAGDESSIGNKARNLKYLADKGEPVPRTLVCCAELHALYQNSPQEALRLLRSVLCDRISEDRMYAVRSSANVEDQTRHSFAGQFETYLDVKGLDHIIEAVKNVWDSVHSERVQAYGSKTAVSVDDIEMAVIVQEMVSAAVSGVAFSHNPLNGLHETVIEAVGGSGDELARKGVTPVRWIHKWGSWIERPERPILSDETAEQVAKTTERLSKSMGGPVDIEWVFDEKKVYCLQVREITGLENINVYSNRLSKEFLPGAIKPLIWSINVPLVNSAWVRLLTEVTGPNDIDPESLAKPFFYRAYFNMGALGRIFERLGFPPDAIELLSGLGPEGPKKPTFRPTVKTLPLLPKMIRCAVHKLRFQRPLTEFLDRTRAAFDEFGATDISDKTDREVVTMVERLYDITQHTAYFNIVAPLLSWAYHAGLRRQLAPLDVPLEDLDDYVRATAGGADDPAPRLTELNQSLKSLPQRLQYAEGSSLLTDLVSSTDEGCRGFKDQLDGFIRDFGHFSENGNDFSTPPWRETPDLIVDMIRSCTTAGEDTKRTRLADLNIRAPKRVIITWLLRKSIDYKLYRDKVSSLYTFGYGLFRDYFLEIGRRLCANRVITSADDVFFLTWKEIRDILTDPGERDLTFLVQSRRREMSKFRDIDSFLPNVIYGDREPVLKEGLGDVLEGLPTSGGVYSGPVKVVRGFSDFDKITDGDVLVVPYSDVGWTPLFAKAGAIVAEAGGMLSHSSIVAREYNIPAVVSVSGACRLDDHTFVTVDGQQGLVRIEEDEKAYASL